jgi:carbohydrate-selective porin OprB
MLFSINVGAESILTRDRLFGDLGGFRASMSKVGINLTPRLALFYQGVASGGNNTNGEFGGTFDGIVNIDGGKLGLWNGLGFNMHSTTRFGYDVLEDAGIFVLPNTGMLYPLPGDYHSTQVTGLYFSQLMFDNRAQMLIGKLNVVDLVSGIFPNTLDYGVQGFWNTNATVSAMPWFRWLTLSMYGMAVWTLKDGMPSTGIGLLGENLVSTTWDIDGSFDDGVGLVAFQRFTYQMAGKPGYVLIFGGGSTKDYPSLAPSDWLNIPPAPPVDAVTHRPWGVAAYWHQVLWQNADDKTRHAQITLGGSVADDNPSYSNSNFFAAFEVVGPLAHRPKDRMGIAMWYTGLGDNFVSILSHADIELRDTWGMELQYSFEVIPSFRLSADLQLVKNETVGSNTAIIPGVRTVIEL